MSRLLFSAGHCSQRNNSDVIANSIYNLYSKGYITAPVPTYEDDDTDVTDHDRHGDDVDGDHRYRGDDDDGSDGCHGDSDEQEEEVEERAPVDPSQRETNSDDDSYSPS